MTGDPLAARLQLADSAFPTGGFAHSAGLEAARAARAATAEPTLRRATCARAPLERRLRVAAVRAAASTRPDGVVGARRRADAQLTNHVANRASRTQGRAFVVDLRARSSTHPRSWPSRRARARARSPAHHRAPSSAPRCAALGVVAATTRWRSTSHLALRGVHVRRRPPRRRRPARGAAPAARRHGRDARRGPRGVRGLRPTTPRLPAPLARPAWAPRTIASTRASSRAEDPMATTMTDTITPRARSARHAPARPRRTVHPAHPRAWAHPGRFRDREPPRRRDYARARLHGRHRRAGRAAARRRSSSRSAARCATASASASSPTTSSPARTPSSCIATRRSPAERIRAVETGGCPHAAIREDISHNLDALEQLMVDVRPELLFVESGGDNLAAQFSRELVDYTIYVIDVAGGDKVPRKGGPGITQSRSARHQQDRPRAARRRRASTSWRATPARCAATARRLRAGAAAASASTRSSRRSSRRGGKSWRARRRSEPKDAGRARSRARLHEKFIAADNSPETGAGDSFC